MNNKKKEIIDALWKNIEYWEKQNDISTRKKLECMTFSVLCIFDGNCEPFLNIKIEVLDETKKTLIDSLHDDFYYEYHK